MTSIMKKLLFLSLLCSVSLVVLARTLEDKWILCTNTNCQILDPYYEEGVSFTWDGEVVNNKAHGQGTAVRYINNQLHSTFVGTYENGIRVGKGLITWADGREMECEFVNNQATGQGTISFMNGDVYTGEFINYIIHGNGVYEKANGVVMEGSFVTGNLYTGKMTLINDSVVYYYKGYESLEEMADSVSTYTPVLGKTITEFFNEDWQRCDRKVASYYRRIKYKSTHIPDGEIRDYYIDGQLQSVFTLVYVDHSDSRKDFNEGKFVSYYKNGNKEQEYDYYNNQVDGRYMSYYQNGQVKTIVDYQENKKYGEYYSYYQTGNLHHYAIYENDELVDGKYLELDENGLGYIVYNEYFYEHIDSWQWDSDVSYSVISPDGDYVQLYNESDDYYVQRSCYIPFDQSDNYKIEATVECYDTAEERTYGLIIGFHDWDNYLTFIISNDGTFAVKGEVEGMSYVLQDWTESDAIYLISPNKLKVFKMNDQFIFAINGVTVANTEATTLRGNKYGIIAQSSGIFFLNDLSVSAYAEIPSPEAVYPTSSIPSGKNTIETSSITTDWQWTGSGFFISEKGYIATNHHVVDGATQLQVTYMQNGITKSYPAEVVVTDPTNDLAIIKIVDNSFTELSQIPYVFTAKTEAVGTSVFALGYPKTHILGNEIKFTDGTISAKTGAMGDIRVYQISVPITYGNSGGPLFDKDGNLVGITSSGWENEDNINYAIKSIYLKNLIEVMPESITLPQDTTIKDKPLVDKIKIISDFVPFIQAK